jgi:uncharacterized membrane protein YbaN (DUF454 family)
VNSRVKRIGILCLGWAFILLGIAGLFLPILQGILFLLIGLVILSTEYVWAHKLLTKLKTRFPKLAEHADAAHQKAERFLARFHRDKHAKVVK